MPNPFINLARNKLKFNFYLFTKLPAAFFSGVRVHSFTEQAAVVTVPYKWFSKNPFRSTYFACLAMAAEMSTGLLLLAHTRQQLKPISTLVLHMEADYVKKATSKTFFTCGQGDEIKLVVEEAMRTGDGQTIVTRSEGKDAAGNVIAVFKITWTVKQKQSIVNN